MFACTKNMLKYNISKHFKINDKFFKVFNKNLLFNNAFFKNFCDSDNIKSFTHINIQNGNFDLKIFNENMNKALVKRDDYIKYLHLIINNKEYFQNLDIEEAKNWQNNFIHYFEIAKKKNLINSFTFNEIIEPLLPAASILEINSIVFWKLFNDIFNSWYHRIGTNLVFRIIALLNEYYTKNENALLIKNQYFNNLTKDKVLSFNLETLINYLKIYINSITNNALLLDIQNLLVIFLKNKNIDIYINDLLLVINDTEIPLDILINYLVPRINFEKINLQNKINFLKILTKKNTLLTPKEYLNEKEVMDELNKLNMNEVLDIIQIYSKLKLGSKNIYLELEKYIGINIDKLPANRIYDLFSNFVNSGMYRDKFLLLMQKKVVDCSLEIPILDLCKIMRIYTDINTENLYIYDKLLKYFISSLNFLSLHELIEISHAYSNKYLFAGNNYLFQNVENIFLDKISELRETENINYLVEILYIFLNNPNSDSLLNSPLVKQLSKNIPIIPKNKLDLDVEAIPRLFNVLLKLKINESLNLSDYEYLITDNMSRLTNKELKNLLNSLKELNFVNYTLIDNLEKLYNK